MSVAVVHAVSVHPLSIPLRAAVDHASSRRSLADPVVVAVDLSNGVVGFGETLPRPYVTGESVDSVLDAVRSVFTPTLLDFRADSFPAALELIDALPWHDPNGRAIPAARAGVELALLDAALRRFDRSPDDIVRWMGLTGFGSPGCIRSVRFSGVLASDDPAATVRQLRRMYWGGLRHFKLKAGTDRDLERLHLVAHYLHRSIAARRASLRIDANAAWTFDQAVDWLEKTRDVPIAAVEQPLPRGDESRLPQLCGRRELPVLHDESLITEDDAHALMTLDCKSMFNIRLSKCGGFLPSLRIAALARRHGIDFQLGCMVGETSILSAAGLRFLEVCPSVRWAEGCFGTWLLRDDIVDRSLRFGYRGRPPRLRSTGWGVIPDPKRLMRFAARDPQRHPL